MKNREFAVKVNNLENQIQELTYPVVGLLKNQNPGSQYPYKFFYH